jgi:hypothetical protein
MRDAAPCGSEEGRQLDIGRRIREQAEPAETLLAYHIAASAMVCTALPHALAFELQTHPIVVADGAWLLPDFVSGLELADAEIASVFLHESDHRELERAMSSRRDVAMLPHGTLRASGSHGCTATGSPTRPGPPRCQSLPRDPMKLLQIASWPSLACRRRLEGSPGAVQRASRAKQCQCGRLLFLVWLGPVRDETA